VGDYDKEESMAASYNPGEDYEIEGNDEFLPENKEKGSMARSNALYLNDNISTINAQEEEDEHVAPILPEQKNTWDDNNN
jgi:hypothetical protein